MQPAKIISAHKPMDAQLKLDVDLAILLKKNSLKPWPGTNQYWATEIKM